MRVSDNKTSIVAWANRTERNLTMSLSAGTLRATVTMTADDARRAIEEIQQAIDAMPAEATAADLGLEAA